ncbi:MAG: anaerobic ribonucleoside-triphosphate reductase activating protein [Spirochaetia bacterium]|jgi:pyruvate formate lyase activating enzyme|nr:anaerobic ribonucleoside-triphosphate reductase activating protein [Spirochaetia bacterium]
MRIGIQKTSLVDFPGRVSAVLFMRGCNMRCPYCHNPRLVVPEDEEDEALVTPKEALEFLDRRRSVLSGAVLSGGEPTLHKDLPALAADIRSLGYKVKLDTNGTMPDCIAAVGADYIAMDIKTSFQRYQELWPGSPPDASERLRRSMRMIRDSGSGYEFRITCVPGIFTESDAEMVAGLLEERDTIILQRYRQGRVLDPAWAGGVSPYTEERLSGLLAIVRRAAPMARIRGL